MNEILKYLKKHGEKLDAEIAEGAGLSLSKTRNYLAELAAKNEVVLCDSIRFEKGKKIEGMLCRVSGFVPPAAPGRKAKASQID
ncbi:MAG TPA: FaeA/PapI family transcriptional regulator [Dehalococcoidia bacterium]|nr:FaeA/PapI family transcriptional regulator [Dehalococcoidia bacterium]